MAALVGNGDGPRGCGSRREPRAHLGPRLTAADGRTRCRGGRARRRGARLATPRDDRAGPRGGLGAGSSCCRCALRRAHCAIRLHDVAALAGAGHWREHTIFTFSTRSSCGCYRIRSGRIVSCRSDAGAERCAAGASFNFRSAAARSLTRSRCCRRFRSTRWTDGADRAAATMTADLFHVFGVSPFRRWLTADDARRRGRRGGGELRVLAASLRWIGGDGRR